MEGPIEPNMGQSLADVVLCTFESTNAGFSSFSINHKSADEYFRCENKSILVC